MNRENILATIADLKAELSNIDATKQQIENSLRSLTELLNSPLLSTGRRSSTDRSLVTKSVRTKFPPLVTPGTDVGIVASDRVRAILNEMHGRFTRSELYRNASNDGNGPIAPGTFANIFSKLIKRNYIKCVVGAPGLRDSVYIKTGEVELQPEQPSQPEPPKNQPELLDIL